MIFSKTLVSLKKKKKGKWKYYSNMNTKFKPENAPMHKCSSKVKQINI